MSTITNIEIQKKNKERCNIFIDNAFSFGVSLEIVLKYSLKKGMELDEEKLKEISYESDKSEAISKAVKYLSNNLKTKRQLKEYLINKGYDEEIAFFVIDKMKEYNLINDVEFAKRYIESCAKKEGTKLIFYKLMNKGIKKKDIQTAFDMIDVNHEENAKNLAQKHLKNKELTKENIQKTYRYLLGKGFSYEEVSSALSTYKEE